MERYFVIHYGCGCGDNEDYIIAQDEDAATNEAYIAAVEDYHSFEGLHGVLSEANIAEELYGDEETGECDLDNLTDEQWEEVATRYAEEIENSIDYWAEEISHTEYLVGIGELDEDEVGEDDD